MIPKEFLEAHAKEVARDLVRRRESAFWRRNKRTVRLARRRDGVKPWQALFMAEFRISAVRHRGLIPILHRRTTPPN